MKVSFDVMRLFTTVFIKTMLIISGNWSNIVMRNYSIWEWGTSRVTFQDSLINGSNIWKKHFQYPNNLGAKFSGNILRCFITTSVLIYGFKSTIFKCVCGIKNAWGISHVWTLMLHMEETLLQSEVCLSLLLLLVNFLLDFHLRTYFQFGLWWLVRRGIEHFIM